MIPYTSCMCFGADSAPNRRRPWRLLTAQKGTGLVFDKTDDNALCIRIREDQESEETEELEEEVEMGLGLASILTDSESCLIRAVENHKPTPVSCDGQVVSVSGRRARQPVITPVLDLNLLDDTYSGVTQILLSRCGKWSFNTFNLDISTGGRSLSFLLVHLFHEYGFVNTFQLDVVKVWRCFNLMEAAYHRHNPYHNSVHAADVTQAMHCFLQEGKFSAHLTPLEAMTSVIAAVAHDLDHPGVTQAFLVATSNHLVNLYNNSSVLENHHWRTAISCLRESGIFDHLGKEVWTDIQGQIRSLILATDITRQKEFLARFKGYLNAETLDMEQTQYRHFALQIALKCADLCNPCRPWSISQRWSYQVCQEFYRQGAYERQLQLPLTPTFDCSRTKVAKIQADFFQFVVSPLFETWDHFLETPLSSQLLRNLRHNYTQWKLKMEMMQHLQDSEESSQTETPVQITVNISASSSPALPHLSPTNQPLQKEPNLLSPDANVVIKQHRSKSDSGLTPRLLTPNIHLETYSTEELHPSTTLLSLSSSTNTVQLRKAYAATKVESHLICPTVFQPLMIPTSLSPKYHQDSEKSDCSSSTFPTDCSGLGCTAISSGSQDFVVQSPISDCSDGCCSPVPPQPPADAEPKGQEESPTCDSPSGCDSREVEARIPPSTSSSNSEQCERNTRNVHLSYPGTKATHHIRDSYSSPSRKEGVGLHPTSSPSSLKQGFCSVNYVEEDPLPKCMPSSDMTPSWCWHISRSLSAERPQRPSHDFDSPLPSWQGSCASLNSNGHAGRRGSAPVTIGYSIGGGDGSCSQWSSLGDMVDTKGGLRGGAETGGAAARRWSIPTEPIAGLLLAPESNDFVEGHDPKETVRRHSFGLLEPFLAMPSSESENDGSSTGPTSTGTTCSTRRNSAVPQPSRGRQCFSSRGMADIELNDAEDTSTFNSEVFLPCFPPSPQVSARRRGSLPAEIPIALMCHVASPSRHLPSPTFEESRSSSREGHHHTHHPSSSGLSSSGGHQRSSVLWEHTRRHGSPGDLLSVLIGPAGMLNAMQGMVYGGASTDWPRSGAQDYTRRRSGGLELLSGLWRSRTSEPPLGSGLGRMKLQRQLLDDWVLWGRAEDVQRPPPISPNRGPGISALSQQLLYQQRRGSVPLDMSLLSLSSGNTYSGDQGD